MLSIRVFKIKVIEIKHSNYYTKFKVNYRNKLGHDKLQ